jgi:enoyl-CoA hydratase/carnithine racemase
MNEQSSSLVDIQDLGSGIIKIILSDPDHKNPLSEKMIDELQAVFDRQVDGDSRVLILASTGNVFSAGHDLKEIQAARSNADQGQAYFQFILKKCSALMQSIVRHPKPVIAQVDGVATAAGCQLALSCDVVYASTSSRFATPGVNIGLFCSTPMVALSRNASSKHSMEMLLTGDFISADEAAAKGLINKSLEQADLESYVLEKANKIASKSKTTLKIGKEAFYAQIEMPLSKAYEYASQVMVENMLDQDAHEGMDAFLDKRKPSWKS